MSASQPGSRRSSSAPDAARTTMEHRAQEQYQRVYEETVDQLEYRLNRDPNFTARELREQLEVMYVQEGNDWLGRGMSETVSMSATIAGMEAVLVRLERGGHGNEAGDGGDAARGRDDKNA